MCALSINVTILMECREGEEVIIPRAHLNSSNADMPFSFLSTQLSHRVAFAMSINESQGQTLSVSGIHLDESYFSASTRNGSKENIFAFAPNGKTKNVVYNEVL